MEKKKYGREVIIVETDYDREITAVVSRNDWAPLPGGWKEFKISKGGLLKIVGGNPEKGTYKVKYKSPEKVSYGTEASDETVFEILRETFLFIQAENKIVKYFEKLEKEIIRKILINPASTDKNQIIIENVEKFKWIIVKNLDCLANDTCFNRTKAIEKGGKLILLGTIEYSGSNFTLVKYENPVVDPGKTAIAPSGTIFWRDRQLFKDIIS